MGQALVRRCAALGANRIDVLIGAEPTVECMKTVTEILNALPVGEFFDPGFGNDGPFYNTFLEALRAHDSAYRTVYAVEDFSRPPVSFYIIRPSSLNAVETPDATLFLCVVHGQNSFVLSRGLYGTSSLIPEKSSLDPALLSSLLVNAKTDEFTAGACSNTGDSPLILESNGREMTLHALRQISIAGGDNPSIMNKTSGVFSPGLHRAAPEKSKGAKININSASAEELKTLNSIGAKRAQTIIEFRETHGPFKSINELTKVHGIGEKTFLKNKDRICVR
jgi:competence ComEA-like helix-hairpin-helix protein